MNLSPISFRFAGFAAIALLAGCLLSRAEQPRRELRLAVIVSRHGVCVPGSNEEFSRFTVQPWPSWPAITGQLTPHGEAQMTRMGSYYRSSYTALGLLSGNARKDVGAVYFRANNAQRTFESARRLGAGLLPGNNVVVDARPEGELDSLFRASMVPVGKPDVSLACAAVRGRIGDDPDALVRAHEATLDLLQSVISGDRKALPVGVEPLRVLPSVVVPGAGPHVVGIDGPLRLGYVFTDTFFMEYVEGRPMAEVGWGRVDKKKLTHLLELHALYIDLTQRTAYPSQVQASNLAWHVLRTLEQGAAGHAISGALGEPDDRLVVLVGHDTNLASLGGLLGVSWLIPGTPRDFSLPGGALVFELWEEHGSREFGVRMHYVSETPDQIRAGDPFTTANQPVVSPIFVPECSRDEPGYAVPLRDFGEHMRRSISEEFVKPGS